MEAAETSMRAPGTDLDDAHEERVKELVCDEHGEAVIAPQKAGQRSVAVVTIVVVVRCG
jgi:hypothetical protein